MQIARISVIETQACPTGKERVASRRNVAEDSTIRIHDKPHTVEILNLSATGCLIRSVEPLEPGMDVLIGLRGAGTFPAEVVRTNGLEAGCQFRKPLRQDQLDLSFTNNVHFIGKWDPAGDLTGSIDEVRELSPRRRAAWILGLAGSLWAAIGLSLYLVLSLG